MRKLGVIVNLAEHTVSFGGYVAPIDKVDGANVAFTGTSNMPVGQYGPVSTLVSGNVDRVTGTVIAMTISKGRRTVALRIVLQASNPFVLVSFSDAGPPNLSKQLRRMMD